MDDPAVTRPPRREWAVTFGVGAVLAGCLVAAVVFMAATFLILSVTPLEQVSDERLSGSTARLAILIGGLAGVGFLILGPTIAFALGWLLRRVANQQVHVLVFALAGVVLGAVVGWSAGGPQLANVVAALVGTSAAAGRMAVSPYARV